MSNFKQGSVLVLDSAGLVVTGPVFVFAARLVPANPGDSCLLSWWDEANPIAGTSQAGITGTITGTNTFTSTGNIPAAYAAGAIFRITGTSGLLANQTRHLIGVAGNGNALVTAENSLVNEGPITYSVTAYPALPAIELKTQGTIQRVDKLQFPAGQHFPNLALAAITAGATLYLYL